MTEPDWASLAATRVVDWAPQSMLVRHETTVPRPRFPVIDVHNHLGRWLSDDWMIDDLPALLRLMDDHDVEAIVNLDGLWGEELSANLERYDRAHPGRFHTFCQLDWSLLAAPDGARLLREQLLDSVARGARGVKVWKDLGLTVRDASDRLVSPDDSRVIDLLALAGEHGLPVLIHTADPRAFFEPVDMHNERLDELMEARDWWFGDRDRHPTFEQLLDAHARLVEAIPGTQVIGAHAGCAAEDLARVEALLDRAPNYSIDIGGRMAELGRQPRRFRALIQRHPDRVLFGTDIYPVSAEQYRLHFRFLESADEAFEYAPEEAIPPQGRWTVSGLDLDDSALKAMYHGNARRLLGL